MRQHTPPAFPVGPAVAVVGIGAALAGLARLRARRRRLDVAPDAERVPLPARPDGAGVLLLVNPSSGPGDGDAASELARRLPRSRLHSLDDGDAGDALSRALRSATPPDVLGVSGGDGSVSMAANLALRHGLPLLVLAEGTFNHFARTAGVSTREGALAALSAGEGVLVDVAQLTVDDTEPVTVLNAASLGVYPRFVEVRERYQPRLGKWGAGVLAAARVLRTAQPIDVDLAGRRERVWSVFVGVNRNRPLTVAPMQRERLADGMLDVRVLRAHSRLHAVASLAFGRGTAAALRGLGLMPGSSEVAQLQRPEVTLRVHRSSAGLSGVGHDGEVTDVRADASAYTARVRNVPGALRVYAPHPSPRGRSASPR